MNKPIFKMMGWREVLYYKYLLFFPVFLVLASIAAADSGDSFNADYYVYWISSNLEKNTFNFNESIPLSGILKRVNVSNTRNSTEINQTDYQGVAANFTLNISILNSSNSTYTLLSQILVNTSSGGIFRTKSDNYPTATPIYAPLTEGKYFLIARYDDLNNNSLYNVLLQFNVFSKSVDKVSLFSEKARYYANDKVVITGAVWKKTANGFAPVENVSLNGTLRRKQGNLETIVESFSCATGTTGSCTVNLSAPADSGKYVFEINNFMASSSFHVVPFDVSAYIKDSTGSNFKEILTTNEQAAIEVKVTKNGSNANGTFIFNGTITDSTGKVVVNLTSTKLNDTNGFVNRLVFTTNNDFTDGFYKASVDVFETGGSNLSTSAYFQVRSWTLYLSKSSDNSGFEYEYAAFPERNVTFEIYPKERANGTLITVVNNTHFNATLFNSLRQAIETSNVTFNSSCGSTGCYKFSISTPNVTGSYIVSVSMNFSSVIQTAEKTIKVTDLTASAFPSTKEGSLKELFSTNELVYISLSAKNISSSVNITNITLGSILYENGTEMNFSRVGGWDQVNNNNSIMEWSFNDSVSRIMLDAPKQGGPYSIKVFINNESATTSTSFIINPYDTCTVAKSSAGTIDNTNNWYIWQFKTTDTVYVELKISNAKNPAGRAPAENTTQYSSQYGMGGMCMVDTATKQVVTNATVTVDKIINLQSGSKQSLNSTATLCSADNDQGQYTCTIKPESKWSGGRNLVYFKIVGPDGQTVDRASTIFESRSFYIWAYANNNAWVQKPSSNITFNVRLYEAGNSWWSNWYSNSQSGGITGSVSAERVNYMGNDGEWIWPPIDYKYNVTGLNSSNVTNGWGTFAIYHDRTPKSVWQSGTYSVTIKGTNDATGDTDYGEVWFSVRQWEAYSTPIDTANNNYKHAYNSKENVSLYVRIYNAGNYNDNGGASLGGNVTISVKKITIYQSGSYKEVNSSLYRITPITVSTSSQWYWSNANSSHILNISRLEGSWDGGWYNVLLDINGTETGYGWFNVIPFNVDVQPVNQSGSYTYTSSGSNPIYFNVSTTKSKKDLYSWYTRGDYINTTIKDVVIRGWNSANWQNIEYNYPEDLNISPLSVNGTGIITVNKTGSWTAGYYYGEITLSDSENSTAAGYLWFSIQPFRVSASVQGYVVDVDSNVSVNINIYQPDWSNNNLVYGNYSITSVTENLWSGAGYSKITYSSFKPSSSEWFNGTTQLNISPNNNAWSLSNGGYRYLTINVVDNNGGSSQTTTASFRAVSISVNIGSISNRYSITSLQNVTLPVTVIRANSGAGTIGNISRIYEWNYPYQTEINFSVGSCNYAAKGTCMINSTPAGGVNGSSSQNIILIPPSGGWSEGYHSLNLEFTSSTDKSQKLDAGSTWFQVVNPYSAYWYNEDENASWKYYFSSSDNISFKLVVYNSSYGCGNAFVNVSKVEVASSSNNCWSDYCRKFNSYSFQIFNQTASWISPGSISASGNELNCTEKRGIRILNNGTSWDRGTNYIRVTVNGSQGNALLKTGYFHVKDMTIPNATIKSPVFNSTINGSLFFNISTSESTTCYVQLVNYDNFKNWYCWDQTSNASNGTVVDNVTVDYRSCNSANFNGSNYHHIWISKWGWSGNVPGSNFVTDGYTHTFNFSTSSLPATQDYGINVYCYDEDWNQIQRRVAFRVNVSSSDSNASNASSSFNVSLLDPPNGNSISAGLLNLTFYANHSNDDNNPIVNCTLYTNFTGSWLLNETLRNIPNVRGRYINFTPTHDAAGTYNWGVLCNASNVSLSTWSLTNRTITLTDSNSNITLSINQSAQNATSFENTSQIAYAHLLFNISIATVSNLTCQLFENITGAWAANISALSVSTKNNNQFITNFTSNQTVLWNIYCTNGTQTGWGQNRTFRTTVNNGTPLSLNVSLESPGNGATISTGSILNLTFRVNHSTYGSEKANCSLFTNFTGAWWVNQSHLNIELSTSSKQVNFTPTHGDSGTYIWGVVCNATNATSTTSSNRTFTLSDSSIAVNLSNPSNNSRFHSSASSINISFETNASIVPLSSPTCDLYTNYTGIWALNMSRTLTAAGSQKDNLSINISTNTSVLWNVLCGNSTVNAWGASNRTLHIGINNVSSNISGTINVTLLTPLNGATLQAGTNISAVFNWSGTTTLVANCSFYTNFTGEWALNNSMNSLISGQYFAGANSIYQNAGLYTWNVYCINATESSISAWAPINFTMRINST